MIAAMPSFYTMMSFVDKINNYDLAIHYFVP